MHIQTPSSYLLHRERWELQPASFLRCHLPSPVRTLSPTMCTHSGSCSVCCSNHPAYSPPGPPNLPSPRHTCSVSLLTHQTDLQGLVTFFSHRTRSWPFRVSLRLTCARSPHSFPQQMTPLLTFKTVIPVLAILELGSVRCHCPHRTNCFTLLRTKH